VGGIPVVAGYEEVDGYSVECVVAGYPVVGRVAG
jgi:hypothetical protein